MRYLLRSDARKNDMSKLAIDGKRVLADLNTLRSMGAYKTGVHKPSLSEPHMQSLKWLVSKLPEADLTGEIDGIGNVVGTSKRTGAKLLAGSHLESQNYAGWLDGPLGVVYALEAARVINKQFPDRAVEVASWFDEEGHFGNFLGSRSFVGGVSETDIDAGIDRTSGETLRAALKSQGLAGKARVMVEPGRYRGYIEAHIEQGDWLETNKLSIGVVTSIVGIWQFLATFTGAQNHAGTTRMAIRKDAGVAAARLCVAIADEFPKVAGERTVWTTGRITLDPGAPSIIPGKAEVLFQIRDADPVTLERMEAKLRQLVVEATAKGPCPGAVEALRKSTPARMDEDFRKALAEAAGQSHTEIPSGAGHDAQILSTVMPAGMMFVPSIGGISHHWTENTADTDIVRGAEVFVNWAAKLLA
jgi:N-carbamoyl-L-amino-acid hydrolase